MFHDISAKNFLSNAGASIGPVLEGDLCLQRLADGTHTISLPADSVVNESLPADHVVSDLDSSVGPLGRRDID